MKLLLDTHALLWWLTDDPRLGTQARKLMLDPATDLIVSTVSLWEILVQVRAGKLVADIGDILTEVRQQGFQVLTISPAHLLALTDLPMHHKDPFDHLLIAQAIAERATFLSEDADTPRYAVQHATCSGRS